MNTPPGRGAFGALVEPATLKIERRLPGPIERIWDYITRSELRRKWVAAGHMELVEGGAFEFIWRNDELTQPPGIRPEGFADEHRMTGRVLACDPPRLLTHTWGDSGEVTYILEPHDAEVVLTIIHRRLSSREMTLMVGAGWHAHLDLLVAVLTDQTTPPFWDEWRALRADYDRLFPQIQRSKTEDVSHA